MEPEYQKVTPMPTVATEGAEQAAEKPRDKGRAAWVFAVITVVFASAFPVAFLLFRNYLEVNAALALQPLLIFLGFGAATFLLMYALSRSASKAAILAFLFIMVGANFYFIEKAFRFVFSPLRYWHVLLIMLFILGHVVYFVYKKVPGDIAFDVSKILALVSAGLVLFNVVTAVPQIVKKASMAGAAPQAGAVAAQGEKTNLPNVYYLLFDEFANFPALEQYFNYANTPLRECLEGHNFTVSENSINKTQVTVVEIPNYFHYDEVVAEDDFNEERSRALLARPPLQTTMESAGYSVKLVADTDFVMSDTKPENGEVQKGAMDAAGASFGALVQKNTVLYPMLNKSTSGNAAEILKCFEYFQTLDYAQQNQVFTVLYLVTPHEPFVFDQNGGAVPRSHQNDWTDPKYYLDQLIFVTKKLTQTIDTIIANDPGCVIILQSDHGCRLLENEEGEWAIDSTNRRNILNAVYYQGEPFSEIQGRSGVNTIRLVLNRLLETHLPLLEEVAE